MKKKKNIPFLLIGIAAIIYVASNWEDGVRGFIEGYTGKPYKSESTE